MFCRNCGKPSEESLCPACAAAQEAAPEAVAPEAVAPEETTPETISFEEAAPTDQPLMELGLEEEPAKKKKKSKKALWISLTAIVAVIGVLVGVFWNTIMGWLRYQTSDPVEWYQEVEMETAKAGTSAIANLYGALIKGDSLPLGNYNTGDTTLELQLNQTLLDAVAGMIPNSAELPIDLNKLQNLSVSTKFTATEDMLHLVLSASGELDLHVYADMPNSKVYLQLPQAQEQALVIDTKQMLGVDLSGGLEGLLTNLFGDPFASDYYYDEYTDEYIEYQSDRNSVAELITNALQDKTFTSAMPSEEEFQGLLDRFSEAAISSMAQSAQKDRRTVEVGDGSETQNVLTTTINESTLRQMLKSVLTVAKDDPTMKKMLDAVSAYMAANGESVDLHSMVSLAVPSLIAELDQPIDDFGTITLETYLNDDNEVVGRSVALAGFDNEVYTFSYNVVDNAYFEVRLPELVINGTITEENDVSTIEFTLPIEGNNYAFAIKSGPGLFSIRFTPPAELVKELIPESSNIPSALLNGLALEVSIECPDASQAKLSVSVLAVDARMITLSLKETLSNETPTLPSNTANVTDLRSIVNWVLTVDRPSLVQALTNLGLKEEFADQLISQIVYEATYNLT